MHALACESKLDNRERATKPRVGDRTGCRFCEADIEYHGKKYGWIDRGGNMRCKASGMLPEDDQTPTDQKHSPRFE